MANMSHPLCSGMGSIASEKKAWLTTDEDEIAYRLAWLSMRWYYLGRKGIFVLPGMER